MPAIAPRVVTLTLPLPEEPASPNWRGHWQTHSSAVKRMRRDASWAAWTGPGSVAPFAGLVRIDAAFYRCAAEPLAIAGRVCPTDWDNALSCCKAYLDGIRDSGLLRGDTAAHVCWGAVTITRCTHGKGTRAHTWKSGVVLTLSEVEP